MTNKFRSGFVSIIGRPNVGKSTLLNSLIGEKIAIVSSKPQTTRNKITSILTTDDFQAIFIDTPGIHTPKSKLGNFMVKSAENALNEVDIILYLVEPYEKIKESDLNIIKKLENIKTSVFLVINKIDTINREKLIGVINAYNNIYNFTEIIPISALKGKNKNELLKTVKNYLKEGPKFFPSDMITDQPERQIVGEIIREKSLHLLQDEIPHGIAVEVFSMKKRSDKDLVDIQATLFCEKESHKGMVIGKNGSMLKKIGSNSRYEMERLLGSQINLKIWVKVKNNWRDNDFLLKNFGYDKGNF